MPKIGVSEGIFLLLSFSMHLIPSFIPIPVYDSKIGSMFSQNVKITLKTSSSSSWNSISGQTTQKRGSHIQNGTYGQFSRTQTHHKLYIVL